MQFGRYDLVTKLASGGMGEVYLARILGVEGFSKWVALKRIYPHLHANSTHRAMFVREAKLLAGLTHPNIVQVLELGTTDDELYMAMELVHGTDLGRLLRARSELGSGLAEDTVAVIAFDLLEALDYAHTYRDDEHRVTGVVHSDVSPQNVMLSTHGYAKLCDFGVAKTLRRTSTEVSVHGSTWGKRAYAAPEVLRGARPDALSDIYSMGVVLHECLTACPLFEGQTALSLADAALAGPMSLREARPDISPAMADLVTRAMAKDPRDRYASARDMRRAVEEVLLAAGPSAAREGLRGLVDSMYTPMEPKLQDGTEVLRPSEVVKASVRWTALTTRATKAPQVAPRRRMTVAPHVQARRRMTIERRAVAAGGAFLGVVLLGVLAGVSLAKPLTRQPEANDRAAALAYADVPQTSTSSIEPRESTRKSKATRATKPRVAIADTRQRSRPEPARPRSEEPQEAAEQPQAEVVQTKSPGTLNINALPWAYVTIDGHRLPEPTPLIGYRVAPGRHVVVLESPNFGTERLSVDVGTGEMVSRTVRLSTP